MTDAPDTKLAPPKKKSHLWKKGDPSPNPKGTPSNLGNPMWRYRTELFHKLRGRFGAKDVIEALEILQEHFTTKLPDGSRPEGWQKSMDMWLDRVLGKAKVEGDEEDKTERVSRSELVVELRRTFGLTVTHKTEAPQEQGEIVEGEISVPAALPAPATDNASRDSAD